MRFSSVNIVQDCSLVWMLTTLGTACGGDSKHTKYMHRFVCMHNVAYALSIILHLMRLKLAMQAEVLLCQSPKFDQNTM